MIRKTTILEQGGVRYHSPEIEVYQLQVEKGFASSDPQGFSLQGLEEEDYLWNN